MNERTSWLVSVGAWAEGHTDDSNPSRSRRPDHHVELGWEHSVHKLPKIIGGHPTTTYMNMLLCGRSSGVSLKHADRCKQRNGDLGLLKSTKMWRLPSTLASPPLSSSKSGSSWVDTDETHHVSRQKPLEIPLSRSRLRARTAEIRILDRFITQTTASGTAPSNSFRETAPKLDAAQQAIALANRTTSPGDLIHRRNGIPSVISPSDHFAASMSPGEKSFVGCSTDEEDEVQELSASEVRAAKYFCHAIRLVSTRISVSPFAHRLRDLTTAPQGIAHTRSQSSTYKDGSSISSRSSQARQGRTEKRTHTDDSNDEEGDDGKKSIAKKVRFVNQSNAPLFACWYHKHDSVTYSSRNATSTEYRSCEVGLFRNLSAIKQHLYRAHVRPDYYCSSCYIILNDTLTRDNHQRAQGCLMVEQDPFSNKLSKSDHAYVLIKPKKPRDMSEEKAWYKAFEALFPGAPQPDSPYTQNTHLIDSHVGIFRALGPLAYDLYHLLQSPTVALALPALTQVVVDAAFRIFFEEQMAPIFDREETFDTNAQFQNANLTALTAEAQDVEGTRPVINFDMLRSVPLE